MSINCFKPQAQFTFTCQFQAPKMSTGDVSPHKHSNNLCLCLHISDSLCFRRTTLVMWKRYKKNKPKTRFLRPPLTVTSQDRAPDEKIMSNENVRTWYVDKKN